MTVVCDCCGREADDAGSTVEEARRASRAVGYQYVGAGEDRCRWCRRHEAPCELAQGEAAEVQGWIPALSVLHDSAATTSVLHAGEGNPP